LFDLLHDCSETGSDAEVKARLQSAGIDMRPAYRRMHQMVEEAKAREQLARAAETRSSMMDRLRDVVTPKVVDLRLGVKELIERVFTGSAQVAHYQKLEKAATDDDLKTLLEDLSKLAAMRERQDTNEPKAK
jgi:DNA-binding TFAR19-related protein (PDSD5 family)